MNIYKKVTVAIASLALGVAAIKTNSVQAATVTYDFNVDVTTGSLADNLYEGSFSYDDSTLTGIGRETVGIEDELSIDFEFLGKTYTEENDNNVSFNFPIVEFNNGSLVGLQYIVSDVLDNSIFSFAIFGDDSDGLGGDKFQYVNENSVEASEGRVIYTFASSPSSVPEPSTVLGLGILSLSWLLKSKVK